MFTKMNKLVNNLNPFSRAVLLYGTIFALAILIIGAYYGIKNQETFDLYLYRNAEYYTTTAVMLFFYSVLSSLFCDLLFNRLQK